MPFNQQRSLTAQEEIQTAISILEEGNRLPEAITARAQAISELAGTSLGTLYRHKGLWHPNYQKNEKRCVIPDAAVDTEPIQVPSAPLHEQPEPLHSKKLQTKEEIMKCSSPGSEDSFKKESKKSSLKGRRGKQLSFPQVERPILKLVSPIKSQLPPAHVFPTPNLGIDAEEEEIIKAIQAQVRTLNLSIEEISQFIAARFDGKRRYQLSHDELILLLYYLRILSSE